MSRRPSFGPAVAAAAACAALLVLEGAAAAVRLVRCPGDPPTVAVPDLRFGWTHPASTTVSTWGCNGSRYEWSSRVSFNASGLNDSETATERPPGAARVLVLGDSVTEALQVPRDRNWVERLETALSSGTTRREVTNAGHSGFGTDNELLWFDAEGAGLGAGLVVLAFNLQNDLAENSETIVREMYAGGPERPKATVRVEADGGLSFDTADFARAAAAWQADPWRSRPALAWLRTHSFLARRLASLSQARVTAPARPPAWFPPELGVHEAPPPAPWLDARRTTEALLLGLRRRVEAAGSRLLVVVVPSREVVDPDEWKKLEIWFPALAERRWDFSQARSWIDAFLAREGFESVDVTEHWRRRRRETGRPGYFDLDPHPDEDGHRWIAEAVYPTVVSMLAAK